jgi:serine/threonine-protein kinase
VRPPSLDSTWNEEEAVRAAANRELNADVSGPSVERLRMIAAFTGLVFVAYFALALLVPSLDDDVRVLVKARSLFGAGIALNVLLFAVTHVKRLRVQFVLDLGYVYLFLLSLLLGLLRHSEVSHGSELLRQVSPVAIPMLAFAALIPAASRKALAVSLGAAAMDPLALFMVRRQHAYDAPEIVLLLGSPFLAAFVAHQVSRVVHRLNEGIAKAREVGSYRLVERLGTGGMAEVWRAEHRMLARPAAVKLIRPEVLIAHGPLESERLLRLFTREARATASLGSPHTIQVYDFGVSREGAFYYVMELLDGSDLQSLVEQFGPQPSSRVAHLLAQTCRSLREAHERNFVHRDIKPANIFTCRVGGEFDFAKVLDFGLVIDRHPTPEELEDDKRFVGTPSVMAPEMVRFHAPVDARADLYALGCVGYWLLTGKRVFEAQTRHDMLVMHAHQRPVSPSRRGGIRIQPELEAIVMACLEKNPNKRPQTASELVERLSALKFDEPWTEERARLWWQRQWPLGARSTRSPEAGGGG